MAVDIKSLLYAGVWRESWPEVIGSGGIAPDLSGAGRHGLSVDTSASITDNGMTWEELPAGGKWGARQDATHVSVNAVEPVRAVAGWFAKSGGGHNGYAEQFSGGLGWGFYLRNGTQLRLQIDGVRHEVILPSTPNDGNLRHLAAAWDDDTAYMWLDGSLVYSAAAVPPSYTGTPIGLGSATTTGAHGNYALSPGVMADVVLRSTPWTDAEVAWLANPANDLLATDGTRRLLHSPNLLGSFP